MSFLGTNRSETGSRAWFYLAPLASGTSGRAICQGECGGCGHEHAPPGPDMGRLAVPTDGIWCAIWNCACCCRDRRAGSFLSEAVNLQFNRHLIYKQCSLLSPMVMPLAYGRPLSDAPS